MYVGKIGTVDARPNFRVFSLLAIRHTVLLPPLLLHHGSGCLVWMEHGERRHSTAMLSQIGPSGAVVSGGAAALLGGRLRNLLGSCSGLGVASTCHLGPLSRLIFGSLAIARPYAESDGFSLIRNRAQLMLRLPPVLADLPARNESFPCSRLTLHGYTSRWTGTLSRVHGAWLVCTMLRRVWDGLESKGIDSWLSTPEEKGLYSSACRAYFGGRIFLWYDPTTPVLQLIVCVAARSPHNEHYPTRRGEFWRDFRMNIPVDKSAPVVTASSASPRPYLSVCSSCLAAATPVTLHRRRKNEEKVAMAYRFDYFLHVVGYG